MVAACEAYETAAGLPAGRLRLRDPGGDAAADPGADCTASGRCCSSHAGAGRVTSLHYGTYDYSASLQVSAEYQSMEHPVADYAKDVMQAAVAGTGVHLSDGSTNILPVGTERLRSGGLETAPPARPAFAGAGQSTRAGIFTPPAADPLHRQHRLLP